ncbi:hypothetical protein SDC9_24998 [bioreactor metagenome]|uniref:Asparagine synthetase domain-containing protein n=1 Tax=bioreactor metagenome TaxID=1076179 RepID=A0A644UK14_9ZZZZ
MFKYYSNLGYNNPYYFVDKKYVINNSLFELSKIRNLDNIIDATAVIELLNKNFMFGDRTIIKGIYKTPWLAKPDKDFENWIYYNLQKHDKIDTPEEELATIFFQKICNEIELYTKGKNKIGILLSGGMDSRIVAVALDYLIRNNRIKNAIVTGFTWGNKNSRDVIYAKEIADRFKWEWKHYTVTGKDLINNITETAISGCEFSPIHLHAIPQIRDNNKDIDIILAGSYGDSIGRAEYSGKKVKYIKPIDQNITNICNLIHSEVFKNEKENIKLDVSNYHTLFKEAESYMQNELDYQLHYMRRMLNPCMNLLSKHSNFHQIFTHPSVYEYIWSINPTRRNDNIYHIIISNYCVGISDIPWARTGLPYGCTSGEPDNYNKEHHSYRDIILFEIWDYIIELVESDEIKNLNLFNTTSIKQLIYLCKHIPNNSLLYYEKLIWLASLAEMIKIYNLKGIHKKNYKNRHYGSLNIGIEYISSILKQKIIKIVYK